MTREIVCDILGELADSAYAACDAIRQGDKVESARLLKKVVDLTYVALDGLRSMPDGATAIANLEPAIPEFSRAFMAVSAGNFKLARNMLGM